MKKIEYSFDLNKTEIPDIEELSKSVSELNKALKDEARASSSKSFTSIGRKVSKINSIAKKMNGNGNSSTEINDWSGEIELH